VMYTQPADPADLNRHATGVQQSDDAYAAEPGFVDFVSKMRIDDYKNTKGSKDDKFTMPGCDSWFKPDDKDAAGNSCFDAHSQISEAGGPCEAGIVALTQLLKKH